MFFENTDHYKITIEEDSQYQPDFRVWKRWSKMVRYYV
jgi:hypothetical protein